MNIEDISAGEMYKFCMTRPSSEGYGIPVISEDQKSFSPVDNIKNGEIFFILNAIGKEQSLKCEKEPLFIFKVLTSKGMTGLVAMWPEEIVSVKEKK